MECYYFVQLLDAYGTVVHESIEGDRASRLALVDGLLLCFDEAVSWELIAVETGRAVMAGLRAREVAHA